MSGVVSPCDSAEVYMRAEVYASVAYAVLDERF